MALTLVRLRWALTVNQWRRSVFTLVMSVLGGLYFLTMAAFLILGLVTGLPGEDTQFRGVVTVLLTSALVLAWTMLPPLVTGVDATLDPRSFQLYPISPGTLVRGLLLSAFTTPVGLTTLLVALGTAASWWDAPAVLPVAVAGGGVSAVTAGALGHGITGVLRSEEETAELQSQLRISYAAFCL